MHLKEIFHTVGVILVIFFLFLLVLSALLLEQKYALDKPHLSFYLQLFLLLCIAT